MKEINSSPITKMITGSKKRTCNVMESPVGSELSTSSYWSGGSRDSYHIYNMKSETERNCPAGEYPTFKASVVLEDNEILVRTGIFMGKPSRPSLTYRADNKEYFERIFGPVFNS